MIALHAAVLNLMLAGPVQTAGDTIRVYCALDPALAAKVDREDGPLSAETRQKRQIGSIRDTVEDVRAGLRQAAGSASLEIVEDAATADVVVTVIGRSYYYDSSGEVETVWASVTAGPLFTVALGINLSYSRNGWQEAAAATAYRTAEWIKKHRSDILSRRTATSSTVRAPVRGGRRASSPRDSDPSP